jgi:hypothetical protein
MAVETSPQFYARTGGVLYLLNILFGIFGEAVVRGSLIVPGDAAATAARIAANESLWRCGLAAEFLALVCAIGIAMIYFFLLRPVSKELNMLATFLRLISIAVQAVAVLNLVTALFPLGNSAVLRAFTPAQRYAMTNFAIRAHGQGFGAALLILGFCFVVHGYLIFRSGFLPRVLGVLIEIAGVCYLTNSFAMLVAPAFQGNIFPFILLPAFVAELSLCLWLIIKGVNVAKWNERLLALPLLH